MMETLQPQSLHAPELLSSNLNSIPTRNINGDKVVIPNATTSESNWNPLVMDNSGDKEATSDIVVELDPSSNSPVDQTLSEVVRETLSSLGGSGTLDQIAKHIISNYPHKTTHKRWRTTIAGILSTHFSKKDNEGLYQKQSIWSIEPSPSSVKRSTRSGRGTNPRRSNSSSNILPIAASSSSEVKTESKRRISSRSSSKMSMEVDEPEGTTSVSASASTTDVIEDEQEDSSDSKEMETEEQTQVQPVVVPVPIPVPIPVISIKKAPEIKDYVGMNLSYHQRVVMSLKALGGEGATYAQICEYFAIHFAKLIEEKKNWKQAIASELSHKFGRKIDKQQGVTLWTLDKDIQEKKPKLKPRKKRKTYGSNGSSNSSENSRSRQSNIKKSVSTEYYSDDSQDDDDEAREMETYRPASSASTRSRRSNESFDNFDNSYSEVRASLSDEEYTKRKRPKRTPSFNMITHSSSTSVIPTRRFSPSASDSEKEETLGDSKKIEISKWKKYVEEAITKLQNRAQLHEILEYIEMSYANVVSKKRLWKNLVALCLKSYFRPEPNQYWTINDGSKSKYVEIPTNWPSTVNYLSSGLDWSDESLKEDKEFFSLEFSYSFMRSKPRKRYVNGDIRVIDYTHPAYKKGVSEYGYFVSGDALPGDYLGEYGGQVQIRKKNQSNESSYLAALWDMESEVTESNPTEDKDSCRLQIDIDASKNGNEFRFLNSCQNVKDIRGNLQPSNAALIRMYDSITRLPCLGIFATKYIPANFEVLLDYSVQDNQSESTSTSTTNPNRLYLNQIMPTKVCYKKFDQVSDDEDTDQDEG